MKTYKTPRGQRDCFTGHGVKRLVGRCIKQADLEDAIDHYDRSEYDMEGNVRLVRGQPDGRVLKILVARDSNPLRIITIIII